MPQTLQSDQVEYAQQLLLQSQQHAAEGASAPEPLSAGKVVTLDHQDAASTQRWYQHGLRLIADGAVAVLLLAGGQGTRLGSTQPKGCFDIGLPSHKSLFKLHAERILKLRHLAAATRPQHDRVAPSSHDNTPAAGAAQPQTADSPARTGEVCVHWYIMTSTATHADTQHFFEQHNYFGLQEHQVHMFQQSALPCLTADGKQIISPDGLVATAPDGNGGVYRALVASGALQRMREHGIKYVDCCSVDNALARVADPAFVGACVADGAQAGARVVAKASAQERVGVFARRDGRLHVVEYSEIDPTMAEQHGDDGQLLFNWANICMHFFTVDWLEQAAAHLQAHPRYHLAEKSIPSRDGETPGVKLEQFIFDPFPIADKFTLFEVERRTDFAPVKNASGPGVVDSPETAQRAVMQLHRGWVEAAGGTVQSKGDEADVEGVEVAAQLSYGGEGLQQRCCGHMFDAGSLLS